MDIEMIQFTGLMSIMLLLGWILITIFFLIITSYVDKAQKRKISNKEEQNDGGKMLGKESK